MESSSSSKRAKAVGGSIGQVANCLVDGCIADLSLCRDYHRRHKVCEAHSKTPRVTIAGREQRFCQQCSRFHSLVEFDEGKRSCRKRLDGHNRRRRKPQPDRGSGLDFSSQPRLVSFRAPQMLGGSLVGSYSWSEMSYNNQVQLVHGGSEVATNPIQEASISSQPFVDPTQSVFPHHQLVDSDGALSLLSSATPDPPLGSVGQRYHQSKAVDVDVNVDSSPATAASTFHLPEGSAAGDSSCNFGSFMFC